MLVERVQDASRIDAILFQLAPLDASVIDHLPASCRLLQRVGLGLDTVDLAVAADRGVEVKNSGNYCTEEVAVHALSMLLSLHRQLDATQCRLLAGHWTPQPPQPIERLSELALGIIGFGQIGQKLAQLAQPLVKQVIYHDPAVTPKHSSCESVDLETLLRSSDLISLHCPLLDATRDLINRKHLALLKPTAILVNVARGALVDSFALAEALGEGKLAAAGLDVFEPEILPEDSPLRQLENVILTSHTA